MADLTAHRLADAIEWSTAKRLLREARKRGSPRAMSADDFYDQHAATELGFLIARTMPSPAPPPEEKPRGT